MYLEGSFENEYSLLGENEIFYDNHDLPECILYSIIADIRHIKGFEVEFYPVEDLSIDKRRCVVFNFPNNLTATDTKVQLFSGDLFVLCSDSFPMNPDKNILYSLYLQ